MTSIPLVTHYRIPTRSAPNVSVLNDDVEGVYIIYFYFTRLKDRTGNLGAIKCILFNKARLGIATPCEFETKGGKAKVKYMYWKKSITHQGKQLLSVLPHLYVIILTTVLVNSVPSVNNYIVNLLCIHFCIIL